MSTEREIKVGVNLDGSKARRESKKTAKQIKKDFGGLSKAQYEATEKEFGGDKMIKALNAESAAANKATAPLQRLTNVTKQLKYPLQASALKTNEFSRSQQNVVNTLSNSGTGLATLGDAGEKLSGTQRSMANYIDSSTRALKKFGATGKNIGAITRVVDKSYKGMNTGIDSLGMNLVKISPAIGDTTAKFGGITDQMAGLTSISGAVSASLNNVSAKGSNFRVLEDAFTKLLKPLPQVSDGFKGLDINAQRLAANTKKSTNAFANLKNFFTGFRMELLGMGFMFTTIGTILTGITKQATASFGAIGNILTKGRMAFIELQGQVKSLMFQFAESDAMNGFLTFLTDILKAFDDLDPGIKDIIFNMIVWGGVIATILGLASFMLLGIFAIIAGIFAWGGALTSLKAGIGAIIAGEGIPGITAALGGGTGLLTVLRTAITKFLYWIFIIITVGVVIVELTDVLDRLSLKFGHTEQEGSKFTSSFNKGIDVIMFLLFGFGKMMVILAVLFAGVIVTFITSLVNFAGALLTIIKFMWDHFDQFSEGIQTSFDLAVTGWVLNLKKAVDDMLVLLAILANAAKDAFGIGGETISYGRVDYSAETTKVANLKKKLELLSTDLQSDLDFETFKFKIQTDQNDAIPAELFDIGFDGLQEIVNDAKTMTDKWKGVTKEVEKTGDSLESLTDIVSGTDKSNFVDLINTKDKPIQKTDEYAAGLKSLTDIVSGTDKSNYANLTSSTSATTEPIKRIENIMADAEAFTLPNMNLADQSGLYSSVVDQTKGSDLANITVGDFTVTNDLSNAQITGIGDLQELLDANNGKEGFENFLDSLHKTGAQS